jgi:Uma2 family endonuclease
MSDPAEKSATYEDLYKVPENMIGEIINGELIVSPRPGPKHMRTASALSMKIGPPFDFGEGGGPGGWIFLVETEVRLGENTVVPDIAGWKKERFPAGLQSNWIPAAPDWVCEILSPSTALYDRTEKKAIYAEYRVGYLWLVDPFNMTIEVYRFESSDWAPVGVFGGKGAARLEPFQEIEIVLGDLWLEDLLPATL